MLLGRVTWLPSCMTVMMKLVSAGAGAAPSPDGVRPSTCGVRTIRYLLICWMEALLVVFKYLLSAAEFVFRGFRIISTVSSAESLTLPSKLSSLALHTLLLLLEDVSSSELCPPLQRMVSLDPSILGNCTLECLVEACTFRLSSTHA